MFNQTRLIRYESYVLDGQSYCNNQKYCFNNQKNESFICPLWKAYCKPYYDAINNEHTTNEQNISQSFNFDTEKFTRLCQYFEMNDSVKLKQGVPGVSSGYAIRGKFKFNFK